MPHARGALLSNRVLVAGISTRAAAQSAVQAGFLVTAVDAFGDLDHHPAVRVIPLQRRFTAPAAARASRNIECDAVVYLSSFENHPNAVTELAADRALWGNSPTVLRRVRDPNLLAEALRRRGMPALDVSVPAAPALHPASRSSQTSISDARRPTHDSDRSWLVKPLASGGGHGVRRWPVGARVPQGCYLQEFAEGTPGSVVFVAAGGRAVPLAVSRQLVGERAFGASGYRYCGNLLAAAGEQQFARDEALVDAACALTRVVTEEFGLVGVNGIDFVARDGVPYPLEVNPRWSASLELVERAYGFSVFAAHAGACASNELPTFDLRQARRGAGAVGKAVVFARHDVVVGDTRRWLAESLAGGDTSVHDISRPSEQILAGRPVCTVFAVGADSVACHAALAQRADRVYAELAAWKGGAA